MDVHGAVVKLRLNWLGTRRRSGNRQWLLAWFGVVKKHAAFSGGCAVEWLRTCVRSCLWHQGVSRVRGWKPGDVRSYRDSLRGTSLASGTSFCRLRWTHVGASPSV